MKYDEKEFFSLLKEIKKQGGVHLDDEVHEHVYHPHFVGPKSAKGYTQTYCNSVALFDIPYLEQDNTVSPAIESIKVCAVDDCIGLWPRFKAANAPGRDHNYLGLPK